MAGKSTQENNSPSRMHCGVESIIHQHCPAVDMAARRLEGGPAVYRAVPQDTGLPCRIQGGPARCRVALQTIGCPGRLQSGHVVDRVALQSTGWPCSRHGGPAVDMVAIQETGWTDSRQGVPAVDKEALQAKGWPCSRQGGPAVDRVVLQLHSTGWSCSCIRQGGPADAFDRVSNAVDHPAFYRVDGDFNKVTPRAIKVIHFSSFRNCLHNKDRPHSGQLVHSGELLNGFVS